MHTSQGCSLAGKSCLANQGCSLSAGGSSSYGDGLNSAGGGIYATEWTSDHINIWFWAKGQAPSDVTGANPNPAAWGTPTAAFQGGSGCAIDKYFNNMQLVFDTTFCGDWAGQASVFGANSQCTGTCQNYVQNNPTAFKDAYWSVNALKVYTTNGASASVSAAGSLNATLPLSTGVLSSIAAGPSSILSAPSGSTAPIESTSAKSSLPAVSSSLPAPSSLSAATAPVSPITTPTTTTIAPHQHQPTAQPLVESMTDGHWNVGYSSNPPAAKEKRAAHHRAARHLAQHARKVAEGKI